MAPWRRLLSQACTREAVMEVAEIFTTAMGTFLFLLVLVGVVLCIIGIVDVARRPAWAWEASGHKKGVWMILNIAGLIFGPFFFGGLMVGLIYLFAIRPKVAMVEATGGPLAGDG
jgi:hypothetical protein